MKNSTVAAIAAGATMFASAYFLGWNFDASSDRPLLRGIGFAVIACYFAIRKIDYSLAERESCQKSS